MIELWLASTADASKVLQKSLGTGRQAANLDIAVAVAQVLQADAQVRITGAGLLPLIDLNGSDTASKTSQQLGTGAGSVRGGGGGVSPFSRNYLTSLSASYVLDFWGKNQSTLVASEENAVASRYNREVVTLTAISTVASWGTINFWPAETRDVAPR